MRRILLATSLFSTVLALALPAPSFAAGIALAMDEVRTITFREKPVATIYIGNPTIADISMIDARHAFIIGKGYGRTNMVALDSTGKLTVFESPYCGAGQYRQQYQLHPGAQSRRATRHL